MSISPAAQARHRIPRIAEAAVERARLTVVPRARTRAARVPFVALVSALLLGGVVGLLLFNTSMQQASFATTALEEQATALSAREETLKMDLERLRDPQVLAEHAQKEGLVPPPASVCFLRPSGKVEGTCTPAVATDAFPIAEPAKGKPAVLTPETIKVPANGSGTSAANGAGNGAGNGAANGSANGAGAGGNPTGDTTRGSGSQGRADGRTGHQQSQQSQQSQQNQQPQSQTRTR